MPARASGLARVRRQLHWTAHGAEPRWAPGTWVTLAGVAPSARRALLTRHVRRVWVARIVGEVKDGYHVRYALKGPRALRYVDDKTYFASRSAILSPVADVACQMGWRFHDGLSMLRAAAEVPSRADPTVPRPRH